MIENCGDGLSTPCAEVLANLCAYLDNEVSPGDGATVARHLDECGPCLREYGLEEIVKSLVRRSCAEQAPQALRSKVLHAISTVRTDVVDTTTGQVVGTTVVTTEVTSRRSAP